MYQCKYCGQEFDDRFKCSGHASRCTNNPTMTSVHECEFCGKQIIGKHSYTQHKNHCELNPDKRKHKTPDRKFDEPQSLTCCHCGKECISDNSLRNHERMCKLNPTRILPGEVSGKRGGWPKGKPAWNKGLTKETNASVAKQSETYKQRSAKGLIAKPFLGKHLSEEHKQKIANTQRNRDHDQVNKNSHGKRGWLDGMFFMSTWEVAYYLYMRDSGHIITRCSQKFEYEYEDKLHTYTPDFLVDNKTIVEVKGYETDVDRLKYTLVPDLVIIDESKISPYLQYVKNAYKTTSIEELYDINLSK